MNDWSNGVKIAREHWLLIENEKTVHERMEFRRCDETFHCYDSLKASSWTSGNSQVRRGSLENQWIVEDAHFIVCKRLLIIQCLLVSTSIDRASMISSTLLRYLMNHVLSYLFTFT